MDFAPTIVTGVYGSGKTEFCVNYALSMRGKYPADTVYIADMDIINPYFRSREKAAYLAERGIEVIGNNIQNTTNQDVPAISGGVLRSVLARQNLIVDLAGSVHGLKALSFFREHLGAYELFVVLNAFREESSTAAKMSSFIRQAEETSGLKATGIVHNSHMLHDTGASHVLYGQELAQDASAQTSVPIVLTFIKDTVYNEINTKITSPVLTFSHLIMREGWQ